MRSLKSTKVAVVGVALTRTKIDPRYDYRDYLYGAHAQNARPAQPATILAKVRNRVLQASGVSQG